MMALPELDTRSVLNVVEENFQRLGLKTYAIRMIYIGEHTLSKEETITHFSKTINGVNSSYCEINVYGLLLVYDSYFVHIIEGSEDTVNRHLRFLFAREAKWIKEMEMKDQEAKEEAETEGLTVILNEDDTPKTERKIFKRLKVVTIYHSICTLRFRNWRAVTARPPSLVGKLDVYGPLQEHLEQLRIFLQKITKICTFARQDANLSFEGLRVIDPKMEALPEVALLDFLLQSQHILDLRRTMSVHRLVDDYRFYFEEVWPLPTHFTPRLLYKLKIDDSFVEPLPIMPWDIVKKEGDEEEREEQQTGSTSSD